MRRQLFFQSQPHRQLTPRETTVLSAAKSMKALDDIALSLDIPQVIVRRHLMNIVGKLSDRDQKLAHQLKFAYQLSPKE